jgi:hypothetical protein
VILVQSIQTWFADILKDDDEGLGLRVSMDEL